MYTYVYIYIFTWYTNIYIYNLYIYIFIYYRGTSRNNICRRGSGSSYSYWNHLIWGQHNLLEIDRPIHFHLLSFGWEALSSSFAAHLRENIHDGNMDHRKISYFHHWKLHWADFQTACDDYQKLQQLHSWSKEMNSTSRDHPVVRNYGYPYSRHEYSRHKKNGSLKELELPIVGSSQFQPAPLKSTVQTGQNVALDPHLLQDWPQDDFPRLSQKFAHIQSYSCIWTQQNGMRMGSSTSCIQHCHVERLWSSTINQRIFGYSSYTAQILRNFPWFIQFYRKFSIINTSNFPWCSSKLHSSNPTKILEKPHRWSPWVSMDPQWISKISRFRSGRFTFLYLRKTYIYIYVYIYIIIYI